MANRVIYSFAVVLTALFLFAGVSAVNAENAVEIVVDGVSANSGLRCEAGSFEAFEDFEDTNVGPNSSFSCEGSFNSLTNNDCYSAGALIPGFSMNAFGVNSNAMVVITPNLFGVTNVAVGANSFGDNTNIVIDDPTDKVSFHVFDGNSSGLPVTINVYDEDDMLIGSSPENLGTAAAPSLIEIGSLSGERVIARIEFVSPNLTGELFYDLAFCELTTTINDGLGALFSNKDNFFEIKGATPEGRVAILWGKKPGSFIVNGPVCNGLELGIMPPKILGIHKADDAGMVNAVQYFPFIELPAVLIEVVDISSCSVLSPATVVPVLND